jgi:sec-independent protein translocase protein TatA
MPFHVGTPELLILLVIVMVIFGVGKLPQVGGAMGKAIREFREGQSGLTDDEGDSHPGTK